MIKKLSLSRLGITFVWLFLISLLRWQWEWGLLGLWLGGLVGTYLLDLDHWLYLFLIHPEDSTSQRVKNLLNKQDYSQALSLLEQTRRERIRLPFHNALFQIFFFGVCFFVLTSTADLFGAGIVMAMSLQFLVEEFGFLLKNQPEEFKKRFFWPLKAALSSQNLKFFVFLMLVVFLLLNLFLI